MDYTIFGSNEYPFTDFGNVNMDWMLETMGELAEAGDSAKESADAAAASAQAAQTTAAQAAASAAQAATDAAAARTSSQAAQDGAQAAGAYVQQARQLIDPQPVVLTPGPNCVINSNTSRKVGGVLEIHVNITNSQNIPEQGVVLTLPEACVNGSLILAQNTPLGRCHVEGTSVTLPVGLKSTGTFYIFGTAVPAGD